jgi:peptidyl-prolyl cis-trans isomerase C
MQKNTFLSLIPAFVVGFALSCLAQPAPPSKPPGKAPADPKASAPAADSVAVTVNGNKIMESEINSRLETLFARSGRRNISPQQRVMAQKMYRQQILDSLINALLVKQDCQKNKITATEKDIEQQLDKMVQQVLTRSKMTREELDQLMKTQSGKSLEENLAQIKSEPAFVESVLMEKVIQQKYGPELTVKEAEIRKFYDDNRDTRFQEPNLVRASHILIDTRKLKTDEQKQIAKKKAQDILKKAQAKDADFAALAKQHSEGPSAPSGGDLNFFPRKGRGAMVEAFGAAAFSLQPGQIYDSVVETQFGYHIIKVTDRKEARLVPFDEAEADIRENLKNTKRREAEKKYTDSLKAKAAIVYPPGKEPKSPKPPMGPGKTAPAPKSAPK